MLSDWLARTPMEIVSKRLGFDASLVDGIPQKDPYIYESTVPPPQLSDAAEEAIKRPQETIPTPYGLRLSQQEKTIAPGGDGWIEMFDH